MIRVTDPADPRRCKGATEIGQCWNEAEVGCTNCRVHGGRSTKDEDETQSYLLAQVEWKRRISELEAHQEPIREISRALAITHVLIEKRMNACKDDAELVASCAPLNQLLLTVERLAKTSVQLQQNLGTLLSKSEVLQLGQAIIKIIIEELIEVPQYEALVDRITSRMFHTITVASKTIDAK
jgi:hypothetical protein